MRLLPLVASCGVALTTAAVIDRSAFASPAEHEVSGLDQIPVASDCSAIRSKHTGGFVPFDDSRIKHYPDKLLLSYIDKYFEAFTTKDGDTMKKLYAPGCMSSMPESLMDACADICPRYHDRHS